MSIYLILLFISFYYLLFKNRIKKNNKFLSYMFLIFTLLSAVRSRYVGVDSLQYYNAFTWISHMKYFEMNKLRYEPFFFILCKILSNIWNNPQILFIVSSIIILFSVKHFITKYSENYIFSTYLYLTLNIYFFHLTGMRQSLAVAFLLFAFEYYINQKYFLFLLFVIVAYNFHSSAIIFFIILLIDKIRYKKNSFFYYSIIAVIFFMSYKYLFIIFSKIFTKYATYLNSRFGGENYFGSLLLFLFLYFLYITCHYFYIKYKNYFNKLDIFLLKILAISTCLQVTIIKMNVMGRVMPYFNIFLILVIPNIFEKIKSKKEKKYAICFISILCFIYYLIIAIFRPEWTGAIPYEIFLYSKRS